MKPRKDGKFYKIDEVVFVKWNGRYFEKWLKWIDFRGSLVDTGARLKAIKKGRK